MQQLNHHYIASRSLTLKSKVPKHNKCTMFRQFNYESKFFIYLKKCPLSKVQYAQKAETVFHMRLNSHTKVVSQPKSKPADLHFRKPVQLFNLHGKFSLMKQLINIYTTNKNNLKFQLKHHRNFWIKKLEMLTPKELNQEFIIVRILVDYIFCSLFLFFDCS